MPMSTFTHRWGIRAAKIWLFENGFIEMGDLLPKTMCDFYAITSNGDKVLEIAIRIETLETVATSLAKKKMYDLTEWRNESKAERKIILFIPPGIKQMGIEMLGCYDEVVEFKIYWRKADF